MKLYSLWKPNDWLYVIDLDNDYYMVKFQLTEDYLHVIMDGRWVIYGHYIMVQSWSPSFSTLNLDVTNVVA